MRSKRLCYRPDVIVTHRHGVRDLDLADALATHCSANGIALLYDLNDDLLDLPPEHPDTEILAARAAVVARMVRAASSVWVSTPVLRKAGAAASQRCGRGAEPIG